MTDRFCRVIFSGASDPVNLCDTVRKIVQGFPRDNHVIVVRISDHFRKLGRRDKTVSFINKNNISGNSAKLLLPCVSGDHATRAVTGKKDSCIGSIQKILLHHIHQCRFPCCTVPLQYGDVPEKRHVISKMGRLYLQCVFLSLYVPPRHRNPFIQDRYWPPQVRKVHFQIHYVSEIHRNILFLSDSQKPGCTIIPAVRSINDSV